jgi:hypothetical protein
MSITIIPQYKMILTYDIQAGRQSEYSQFILGTFLPGIQALDLYVMGVYHTVIGDYPDRHAEFVSESWDVMVKAIESSDFQRLENTLKSYTLNYRRKVVKYRNSFQM